MSDEQLAETLVASRPVFAGRMLTVQVDTTRLPDGRTAEREIVRHPGAVGIVAVDGPDVVLVRQFRHAIGRVLLEIPAGKLDPGEAPDACARRELAEETGLQADRWIRLGQTVVSPGYCNEVIHLFRAEGLRPVSGPACDDDEFIELVRLAPAEALARVQRGEITDAKTQIGLLLAFGASPRAGESNV